MYKFKSLTRSGQLAFPYEAPTRIPDTTQTRIDTDANIDTDADMDMDTYTNTNTPPPLII